MFIRFILAIFITTISFNILADFKPAKSWNSAKNILDDKVYFDHRYTLYCGCKYKPDNDSDGSGDINTVACGLDDVQKMRHVKDTIQWEHIVTSVITGMLDHTAQSPLQSAA